MLMRDGCGQAGRNFARRRRQEHGLPRRETGIMMETTRLRGGGGGTHGFEPVLLRDPRGQGC